MTATTQLSFNGKLRAALAALFLCAALAVPLTAPLTAASAATETAAETGAVKAAAQNTAAAADNAASDRGGVMPTRDSLVGFWEKFLKNDSHVAKFRKTDTDGVYDLKTNFFPYAGRVKLLNAVVTQSDDSYYPGLYSGIVEVELLDAKPEFFKKYAASYAAWTRQNYFYFDSKKAVWFPAAQWSDYMADADTARGAQSGEQQPACAAPARSWKSTAISWGPWIFYSLFVVALIWYARRNNRRVWDNHARALSEQQRGLSLAEESLKIQRDQMALLTEILYALQKRH